MNILIIGRDVNYMEAQLKFGDGHAYFFAANHLGAQRDLKRSDVVFDFQANLFPKSIEGYRGTHAIVFVETSMKSLLEIASTIDHKIDFALFGFCGLPTFLNRSLMEVSLYKNQNREKLEQACKSLNTAYSIVDDRVGLVMPRIVCMIINEAYYTVQEGTASREDIDMAMKLGTNYPYGPFEWASRIGITNVYDLLDAVYQDTRDERYKICPLLKKERLALS